MMIIKWFFLLFVLLALSPSAPVFSQENGDDGEPVASETAGSAADEEAGSGEAGHTAGHGDHELDPTHMNLPDDGESATAWRSDRAIATLVVFLLMLAGLNAFAWKPISQGLAKREKSIAANIAQAERAAKEAEQKLADYEAKLASANEESQRILAEARKDAEATGQRMIAEAQEEAARQREKAVAEIESAKQLALGEIADRSTDIAVSLAKRIVAREVNPSDHQSMIQDMLSKLPSQN